MLYSFQLEPEEILGVARGASLEEIRTAFREKAKKYHPDAQGDPWAFRIIQRAHELLVTARVASRVSEESVVRPATSDPRMVIRPPDPGEEQVRTGVRDDVDNPAHLVDVDLMLLRFAMEDPVEFFLLAPEDRNLSCNLSLIWPSRRVSPSYDGPPQPAPYLKTLHQVFASLTKKSRPLGSRDHAEDGRFMGWLSYPTAAKTSEAFQNLRLLLREKGFGVDQRTRELLVPREQT